MPVGVIAVKNLQIYASLIDCMWATQVLGQRCIHDVCMAVSLGVLMTGHDGGVKERIHIY